MAMKIMRQNPKGFTIFFAVLVASLALSVGLVIYDLLLRQLALSQVATQSQYAIYAADTGAECALYWDLKYNNLVVGDNDGSAFSTSSAMVSGDTGDSAAADTVVCNGQDIVAGAAPISTAWSVSPITATAATTTFWISMGSAVASACAKVEVGKNGNPSQTTIVSHGYNTCGTSLRLERSLQINY